MKKYWLGNWGVATIAILLALNVSGCTCPKTAGLIEASEIFLDSGGKELIRRVEADPANSEEDKQVWRDNVATFKSAVEEARK